MPEPNYDNYSLEELQEALATIDDYAFPERSDKIRAKIKGLQRNKTLPVKENRAEAHSELPGKEIDLEKYLRFYTSAAPFLYLISLLFGLATFINCLIPFGGFGYYITLQLPGIENLSSQALKVLFYSLIIPINSLFIISAIGSFIDRRISKLTLAICWGLFSFGFQLWQFKWWPTAQFDIPLSFGFDLFGLATGFKINLVSAFFFGWAAALSPEMRREIEMSNMTQD